MQCWRRSLNVRAQGSTMLHSESVTKASGEVFLWEGSSGMFTSGKVRH